MAKTKWFSSAAYIQGLLHVRIGLPCQDRCTAFEANGISLIALSDGCGSSEVSEIGSELTISFISEYMTTDFDRIAAMDTEAAKKDILSNLIKKYSDYLSNHPDFVKDYVDNHPNSGLVNDCLKQYQNKADAYKVLGYQLLNSTLLFVAIKDNKAIMGQMGDGYIYAIENNRVYLVHEESKSPDVAENATVYPFDIYVEAASMDNFYLEGKDNVSSCSLFALSSDGPDSLIIKPQMDDESSYGKKYVNHELLLSLSACALANDPNAKLQREMNKLNDPSKGFVLSSNQDDCSIAILRVERCDVLWSLPTKVGTIDVSLDPINVFPGQIIKRLASKKTTSESIKHFYAYYFQGNSKILLAASDILDGKKIGNPYLEMMARNALLEFGIPINSEVKPNA